MTVESESSEFIARLRAGDEEAVEQLCRVMLLRLMKIFNSYGFDDVEARSWANWAIAVALRQLGTFQSRSRLSTWMCGIARNVGRRSQRDKFQFAEPRDVLDAPQLESIDDPALNSNLFLSNRASTAVVRKTGRSQRHVLARRAWLSLAKTDRRVLVETKCLGLTHEEIARRENVSVGTIASRCSRARQRLNAIYREITADRHTAR